MKPIKIPWFLKFWERIFPIILNPMISNIKNTYDWKKRYDNLPSNINEVLRNIDLLDYQIKVIEEVDPKPFEDDELSERFKTLNNKEEIKEKNIWVIKHT